MERAMISFSFQPLTETVMSGGYFVEPPSGGPSGFWMAAAACMAAAAAARTTTKSNVVVINTLGKSFTANKTFLWAYSGYFKTVLDDAMTSFNLASVPAEFFEAKHTFHKRLNEKQRLEFEPTTTKRELKLTKK